MPKTTTDEMISVAEAAPRLGLKENTLRNGIRNHTIPLGIAYQGDASCGDRCSYLIPRRAFELWMRTGVTPADIAIALGFGKDPEQALAYLRELILSREG